MFNNLDHGHIHWGYSGDHGCNLINGYESFNNTKAYMHQKKSESLKAFKKQELFSISGYKNISKFYRRLDYFPDFNSPIPITFLKLLGNDLEVIKAMVEIDQEEYDRQVSEPRFPNGFTIRLMPGIYHWVPLPDGINEYAAIEYVSNFASEGKRLQCVINYPHLLSLIIEPSGNTRIVYNYPVAKITGTTIVFNYDGNIICGANLT